MDNIRKRWDALSRPDQQTILDKHRDINTDHDWWDSTYADFVEKMKEKDIEVSTRTVRTARGRCYEQPEINFSGFWSQGDGASFSGYIHGADVLKRMKEHKVLGPLTGHITDMGSFTWNNRHGNYCHSGCMTYSFECYVDEPQDDDPPLRRAAKQQIFDETTAAVEDFEKELWAEIIGYADQLYKDLETEHDYLSSDKAVLETLMADDMLEDELKEYEDDESDEPESDGSPDCGPGWPAAGPLLLRTAGDASEVCGEARDTNIGSGWETHLLQPGLCAEPIGATDSVSDHPRDHALCL